MQARERAWRIGQTKNVTIYRLLTSGTIEEKIYHRQIFKQFLTNRVLQDPKQRRFFKSNDLHELFRYDDDNDDSDVDERTETSVLLAGTNSEINLKENYQKRKRKKNAKFEGKHVPNLTKVSSSTTTTTATQPIDVDKEKDDYVLSKLFKKSGVHSALQHDTIIDNSINDYVFIEAEAHRYAEEAVKALKKSARECYSAESGIPNWGARNIENFSSQRNQPSSASTSLLNDIRQRKREHSEMVVRTNENRVNDDDNSSSNVEHFDLVQDLKDYLAAGSSITGKATTEEIIEHFQNRINGKKGLIPKFKSLLKQLADLQRTPSGMGFWVLKDEFR